MNSHPTKFIGLLIIFLLLVINHSCSKDSDLFNEVISEDIENNIQNLEEEEGNDNTDDLVFLTKTFYPIEDAYVQDGLGINNDIIRIENGRRKSYLTFDLSEIGNQVSEASLALTISQDAGYGTFEAHEGISTGWNEDNLSSDNAPSESLLLGSTNVEPGDGNLEIPLNPNEIVSGQLDLVLVQQNGNDIAVSSKENANAVVPKLTISYMGIAGDSDEQSDDNDSQSTDDGDQTDNDNSEDESNSDEENTENDSSDDTDSNDDNSNQDEEEQNNDNENEEDSNNNNNEEEDSNNGNDEGSTEEDEQDEGSSDGSDNEGSDNSEEDASRTGDINYYVSVDGSNSNDGLSEATPFNSIQRAIDYAEPGDIVWVKAGNYGGIDLFTRRSGTSSKPISIIGYRSTPGDIVSNNGSTFTYQDLVNNGGTLDGSTDMPYLDNNTLNPDESDRAFNIDHSYITIKNFKIQEYEYGADVDESITGVKVDNVFCNKMGNWDPSNPGYNTYYSETEPNGNLNGNGFRFKDCTDCDISNSTVVNAGHVGIKLNNCYGGNYSNIAIYSTETGNATDYNFLVYNSSNTTVTNLTSYREDLDPNLMHQGRGYVLQCDSTGNLLDGAVITNTRMQVFQGPYDNVLKNVTIQGNGDTTDGAVMVGDAAHDNIFYNFRIDNCNAIQFYGTKGVQCGYDGTESAGNNNFFVNFIVTRPPLNEGFITFDEYDTDNTSPVGTAYVIGGTFYDATYAIQSRRANTQLYVINTTFSNIGYGLYYSPEGVTNNVSYINCNFYDVNFNPPNGTNITTYDPKFSNAASGDFTLQSSSLLIDAGTDATNYLSSANIDFNNDPRPQGGGWDIGAYEY